MLFGLLAKLLLFCYFVVSSSERSFKVDYAHNTFLKDGRPFRYISGSIHYFRVPYQLWEDRLLKMKAAGLNAIQTYIEWSSHEPRSGTYDFEGNLDFQKFLELAQKIGLLVILRPGPYIDAERDMGGLPSWLLGKNPKMKLRTSDPSYLKYVDHWFTVLLPKIKPLLYENGGPVIGVQVENEYGSYYACDRKYTVHLRDLIRKYLGNKVYLFTTDGDSSGMLDCGSIPGVYATVDFGCGGNVDAAFAVMRKKENKGPLVNSEFYTGWLDHWFYPHSRVGINCILNSLRRMLDLGASVNMYMFHGGTSFGFKAGSNYANGIIQVCPTSYDYAAPISEAGDTTALYGAIRKLLASYVDTNETSLPPVPPNTPKAAYGKVKMEFLTNLLPVSSKISTTIESSDPLTFEKLGQDYGFILYVTEVKGALTDPVVLNIPGIRDRGYVFVDREPVGILSREVGIYSLPLRIGEGTKELAILVENQGRICVGSMINDFKGIMGRVKLGSTVLKKWKMTLLPFNSTLDLIEKLKDGADSKPGKKGPAFYTGELNIQSGDDVRDTFLRLDGWGKGVVFVNGFNLGRYWPHVGPQVTLYVPKTVLKKSRNSIVVLELEEAPVGDKCLIEFTKIPEINGPTPFDTPAPIIINSTTTVSPDDMTETESIDTE